MSYGTPHDKPLLRGPVPLSHLIIRQFVTTGAHVVDATCGNGHDTLLLAERAGPTGRVWAFDIQTGAIEATAARLDAAGYRGRVDLVQAGHESMTEHCPGPVRAVVFNLGYLPGSDRTVITRPDSTLTGVDQSLSILEPGGITAITLYPGHAGGGQESNLLEARLAQLSPAGFHVWRMAQTNAPGSAPYLILIQKAS